MNDTTRIPSLRKDQALIRRNQILDTALTLFGTHGFTATTTKHIAKAVGVSEGLIFRYFPTKTSILDAIAQERDALAHAFVNILESAHELPASVVVERVAVAWMTITRREQDFMAMLISEGQINPAVQTMLHRSIATAVTGFAQYLEIRVHAGEIRSTVSLHTAATQFFGGLLLFFITHRHSDDSQWSQLSRSFVAQLRDSWLHGTLVVLNPHDTVAQHGGDLEHP